MTSLLHTFPRNPRPIEVVRTNDHYVYTKDGTRYLDLTAGGTAFAVIGYNRRFVNDAIKSQLELFCHVDYKSYSDKNRDELADLLCSSIPLKLNRVFFSGGSGSEACEMAVQISYQTHCELGQPTKKWYLSRMQSYHGSTSGSLSLGERPNLDFYKPLLSPFRKHLPEYNFKKNRLDGESEHNYAKRLVDHFESALLSIGPENVGGFVAETILGGLVGDVPSSKTYWTGIREVCTRYDVHLILDEVWCGTGVSGKINCVEHYDICPDFLFLGKTLGAGYIPLSAVLLRSDIADIISTRSGRFETSCTFQGHSLACASALAVQKYIHTPGFVDEVEEKGNLIRSLISAELGKHEFFVDIRGLGVRNSLEYNCDGQNKFGPYIADQMKTKHNILISGKWHRFNLSHAMTLSREEIHYYIECLVNEFKSAASKWTPDFHSTVEVPNFF
jgi:adenosylmethionine-8-amino-7-oxononanoate aminotransferase